MWTKKKKNKNPPTKQKTTTKQKNIQNKTKHKKTCFFFLKSRQKILLFFSVTTGWGRSVTWLWASGCSLQRSQENSGHSGLTVPNPIPDATSEHLQKRAGDLHIMFWGDGVTCPGCVGRKDSSPCPFHWWKLRKQEFRFRISLWKHCSLLLGLACAICYSIIARPGLERYASTVFMGPGKSFLFTFICFTMVYLF